MIVEKKINNFVFHYSDLNMKIRQVETGLIYDNAMDEIPCPFTYEETDIPVPVPETPEEDETIIANQNMSENEE